MTNHSKWAALLLAVALSACAGGKKAAVTPANLFVPSSNPPGYELLLTQPAITGGQLATEVDFNGFPLPGSLRGFTPFVYPAALAVRNRDMYVVDSGARKLYRLDLMTQILSVVPSGVAYPWTRVQVGADRSLYVLDQNSAVIRRYVPMQAMQTIGDPAITGSLEGFVVDTPDGRIVASDKLNKRLIKFNPMGGLGWPMPSPAGSQFTALGMLASAGERSLYAIENSCACVAVLNDAGQVSEHIGRGILLQPQALAVDRTGHLFVADAADRTLKVFAQGKLLAQYTAQALRVSTISALAVDENMLYIADGAGSRVQVFRIQPQTVVGSEAGR